MQLICTNADGYVSVPNFFLAEPIIKYATYMLVRRLDGVTGAGPHGLWIINTFPVNGRPLEYEIYERR